MRPESDISPAAPGLASGAWPLAQPRSRQPGGGAGLRCTVLGICCSPTTACHPPRCSSNPHYGDMSWHSNNNHTALCHSPVGRRGIFLELPERTVRAPWGGGVGVGRVDAFWTFLQRVGAVPTECQLFLSLVLPAPSIIFIKENATKFFYSRPVPATH